MRIILRVLVMMILILGCAEEVDFRIECATLDQGWVQVQNNTGVDLLIDVTWSDLKENAPIYVEVVRFDGRAVDTVFDHVPQGTAKIWYSSNNGMDWKWTTVDVVTCEKTYCVINFENLQ